MVYVQYVLAELDSTHQSISLVMKSLSYYLSSVFIFPLINC